MTNDSRVPQLLDKLLASQTTPEAVCESCPELLTEVRKQWQRIRRLCADLDYLFPTPGGATHPPELTELPQVPGYQVEGILGRGGMGIVFRARHLGLNRPVALKMALGGTYVESRARARFQREAEAAAGLRHPNIVQVYDVGEVEGQPYFTMELIDGQSLTQKLDAAPQPVQEAAQLATTLASAVQAAHDCGIVHRDLKPANVLLTADGTPKITDFGLARRMADAGGLTQSGMAIGSPSYMAPEQARGQPDSVGPAADVYALGTILYELLTGRPPFRAATAVETVQQVISQEPAPPSRLNDKVPRDLETICLKCLNKEPSARYGTAAELAADLSRFQKGEPIKARRAGLAERLVKWTRRHRSLAASLVTGTLLAAVLLGVGVWTLLERAALRRVVNEDLDQVVLAEKEENYDQARTAMERAKARLGDGGPRELRRRAEQLGRELAMVRALEEIILSSVADSQHAWAHRAARFEAAFREMGFIEGQEDPAVVAARIRASGIAAPVLAALDYWADGWSEHRDAMARDRREPVTSLPDWVLEVARLVDDDPASRPIRDGKLWENKATLEAFAQSAPLANHSVSFLVFLSRKLEGHGGNTIAFLKRIQQAHVNSDIANATLANSYLVRGNAAESVSYFRAAIALRPTVARFRVNFAKALSDLNRWDEALVELEVARRQEPDSAVYNTAYASALTNLKKPVEAERELRRVLVSHPTYSPCLVALAQSLFQQGRHEESFDTYRRLVAASPNYADAYRQLKDRFLFLHRWEEGRQAWQQWLASNPSGVLVWEGTIEFFMHPSPHDHAAWDGYAELCLYLGKEAEYRRARTELLKRFGNTTDPQVAERTGRACLLLPASEDELRQAGTLIDRALASQVKQDGLKPYFRFAKALAEYRAGDHKSALALLEGALDGPAPPRPDRHRTQDLPGSNCQLQLGSREC
jgi:tetratricopeptide (TPR) repeat protein